MSELVSITSRILNFTSPDRARRGDGAGTALSGRAAQAWARSPPRCEEQGEEELTIFGLCRVPSHHTQRLVSESLA